MKLHASRAVDAITSTCAKCSGRLAREEKALSDGAWIEALRRVVRNSIKV
ncbi:MAG: hypothetical protein WC650_05000 [Candidatus Doudnabacteria bacterium]